MRPQLSTAITLAGVKAHRWLQHSRHGRVAAVYKQCLYLADHRNELICIGSRRLGAGPINALCDADWEPTGSFKAGDAWQRQGDAILVGAMQCFRVGNPNVWRPAPIKGPWDVNAITDRLHRARDYLAAIDAGPLMPLVIARDAPGRNRLEAAFGQRVTSSIHALMQWLEHSSVQSPSPGDIPEDVVNLIGLGPGLTPSGDDFLGGALVALRTLNRNTAADQLAAWIKHRAPALTNDISLAHLIAACDGDALDPVHQGLNALLKGSGGDEIETTLANLSAVGHSSGWDAFSGVLAVVDAWQRERRAGPRRDCAQRVGAETTPKA